MNEKNFANAILEATYQKMTEDDSVFIIGLGVPDPKGIFGTTLGLFEKFGSKRVFDMPISENALTGICIGAAINGLRPIITHQRADFFFLALDQLINNASKWHYMFANQMNVPLVIRLMVGHGWGQGPQHSQSIHGLINHIPGIKIVMPSNPYDAKGLLIASIEDNNPVVFIEHRWLHNMIGEVPDKKYSIPIGKGKIVKEGNDITIISFSNMTVLAKEAAEILEKENISAEILDLRTIKPLDEELIIESVKKTKRVIILDPDWKSSSVAAEIMAIIIENTSIELIKPPIRITYPDRFVPTAWTLSNFFYPTALQVVIKTLELMDKKTHFIKEIQKNLEKKVLENPLDVPDKSFKGPF
ncbi:MAG: acetoin dehydrogenase [Chlamydiae bacterium RIFCSPLOWO2_01_FULL_28_7]|nr:MAG: acetoin dehydrogenase [Chlamydiae bacterium RIFCSPLOWO2_01_FULL_28_7]